MGGSQSGGEPEVETAAPRSGRVGLWFGGQGSLLPSSACLPNPPPIFLQEAEVFVLETEGPNLYQLRRVPLWTKGSALGPLCTQEFVLSPLCTIHNPKRLPCHLIWPARF